MVHFEPWKHMGLVLDNGIPYVWPCSLFACEFEEWQAIKLIDSRVSKEVLATGQQPSLPTFKFSINRKKETFKLKYKQMLAIKQ